MSKTTKSDFNSFKLAVQQWRQELGLMDWRISFKHKPLTESYAETTWDAKGHVAVITLATSWHDRDKAELSTTALHECLHLVLAEFADEASARYATSYRLHQAEEQIIVRLVNFINLKEQK